MGGEHIGSASRLGAEDGSSPHGRGAPSTSRPVLCRFGIIPAWAGSTGGVRGFAVEDEDHPRMGGEHTTTASSEDWPLGSSPHGRGARNS